MTAVVFKFTLPTGEPLVDAEFTVSLRKPGMFFDDAPQGIAVPDDVIGRTDAEGKCTLELLPLELSYYLTLQMGGSDGNEDGCTSGFRFRFRVPESASPVDIVDLVVTEPTWSQAWDEKALGVIIDARVAAVDAAERAKASELAAEADAQATAADREAVTTLTAVAGQHETNALNARDAAQTYATDAAASAQETDADRIATAQFAANAQSVAEETALALVKPIEDMISETPGPGKLPKTGSAGKLSAGWLPSFVFSLESVKDLLGFNPVHNSRTEINTYYAGRGEGGGSFVFDANMPKSAHNGGTIISTSVPWDGTQTGLKNFLDGVGETDPNGKGCHVRPRQYDVYMSWFGCVGDAVRPGIGTPDGPILGTDDTYALRKCIEYMQTVAIQPNLFVGFHGGFRLNAEPNRVYKLSGHNVMGTTRPRNSVENPAGQMARQNWFIEGNAAMFLWWVEDKLDCFIETHETITRLWGRNFTVIACNVANGRGIFVSNIANPGRNALAIPRFERVEVYGVQPNSPTNGLYRIFQFYGTNLGDRLNTNGCSFNQFHEFLYSENSEAVGQGLASTSITTYIEGAKLLYLRTHGSGFNFGTGCNILMKGENQTLIKTEYMPGAETGVNGSSTYINFAGCRYEGLGGAKQTIVDADFGVIEVEGITLTKGGGVPSPESKTVIARKGAVVRIKNSNLYGRYVVGLPNTDTLRIKRAYALKFENCSFINDLGKSLYVEDAAGSLIPWRTAQLGNYLVPAVVVKGTDSRTIGYDGMAIDASSYVFDGVYQGNMQYNTIPDASKLVIGRYRGSSGNYYLDNTSYVVLPPFSTITSIKVTHSAVPLSTMDTLRIKVGSAVLDYALTNNIARTGYELLTDGKALVISDDDKDQRTISTECLRAGVQWAGPSFIAMLVIEWRSAYGRNEMTAVEVDGIRQSRIIGG